MTTLQQGSATADPSPDVVAITGAAGGIGHALCGLFAQQGSSIVAVDKDPAVHDLADALRARGIAAQAAVLDISDGPAVAEALGAADAERGPISVLINNAGITRGPSLERTSLEDWHADIEVNLNGAYHCVRAVLPAMKRQGRGAIVTVGSVNGLMSLGDPAYSAAKAALISMTRSLATEYGPFGIRCNIVVPGTVRTPIWQSRAERNPDILENLVRWYPLGRVVEPAEVAQAVAFLASERASAITGATLAVDCGLTAGNALMASDLTAKQF